ncbi:G/u mismatch-specific DNA glycosylase [Plakobranchus ocellatus]|uniref:G/T mismatch-specific thymine DNA glycosylase n=1 Tax=Plakobranchus ocellatus TaxID=259542 RepID=A0AAV4BV78_9GAST|nr:G/u mismatch-specific DNA glycosylase [Plakobranchus ocellatus]
MNQIKQEPWESSCDYQDYQWSTNSGQGQTPQYSQYFSNDAQTMPIKIEAEEENVSLSLLPNGPSPTVSKEPKKRGRPKKIKDESGVENDGKSSEKKPKVDSLGDPLAVGKKKRDRFNGMTEDEVLQKHLPDHLAPNLDILIVGINPGLFAAYVGHHYAGPGNHFWKCLHLSGLIPEPMNAYDDYKLIEYGIGFTNICARTTRGSADLKKQEIKEGADILRKKLALYKPKIAVFNGKGIYEVFSGNKNFHIGKQPDVLEDTDTVLFVMPSSSARCAQLPRAVDKVPFYVALKKLRDYLKGELATLDDSEVIFPNVDLRPKADMKEETFDLEEEDSRMSAGDSSNSKEMTLEQIQMQSEYLEALAASAEGKDIPMESLKSRKHGGRRKMAKGELGVEGEGSCSGDELSQPYRPQACTLNSDINSPGNAHPFYDYRLNNNSMAVSIKQETDSDNDYGPISISKPTAQKVNLDFSVIDRTEFPSSSAPQYTNLGDIPSKKTKSNSSSIKSPRFSNSSSGSVHWPPASFVPSHLSSPGFPFVSQGMIHRGSPLNSGSHYFQHFGNGKDLKPGNFLNI